jgi:hypothetical protein
MKFNPFISSNPYGVFPCPLFEANRINEFPIETTLENRIVWAQVVWISAERVLERRASISSLWIMVMEIRTNLRIFHTFSLFGPVRNSCNLRFCRSVAKRTCSSSGAALAPKQNLKSCHLSVHWFPSPYLYTLLTWPPTVKQRNNSSCH